MALTRTARAFAFLIDGGFAVNVLLHAFAMSQFLANSPFFDPSVFAPGLERSLADHAVWCFLVGAGLVAIEATQGRARLGTFPSMGFVISGLELDPPPSLHASRLRRATRIGLPVLALFAASVLIPWHDHGFGSGLRLRYAHLVISLALAFTGIFGLIDAIAVLSMPDGRTIGDRVARTTVWAAAETREALQRSLRTTAHLGFVAAAFFALALIASASARGPSANALSVLAGYVGSLFVFANAATYALVCVKTSSAIGMRPRHPLTVALLVSLPLVAFVFLHVYARRLTRALSLPLRASVSVRAPLYLATLASGLAFLGRLRIALDFASSPGPIGLSARAWPWHGPPPDLAGVLALVATVSMACAHRRLSELDFDALKDPERKSISEVFA